MIGGPLNAVVKAQAQSAQTSVDFIKSIGFNAPDAANDPASRQVSAIYRSEAPAFIDAYIAWLEQTERELAGLRAPVSILLQAEKSLLTAVLDGSVPAVLNSEKSVRKRQRAVAAQSLERISKEIQTKMRKHRSLAQLEQGKALPRGRHAGHQGPGLVCVAGAGPDLHRRHLAQFGRAA